MQTRWVGLAVLLAAWPALATAQQTAPWQPINVGLYGVGNTLLDRTASIMQTGGGFVVAQMGRSAYSGSGPLKVQARRFDAAGQPLGGPFQVSQAQPPQNLWNHDRPGIAADASGAFTVVWSSRVLGPAVPAQILARRFDSSGTALGDEFSMSPSTGAQREPAIATDPSGRSLVVWVEGDDGSGTGIAARVIDAAGVPQGAAFRVNSDTSDMQLAPAVAADDSGRFVAVWHSRGQDGSEEGVFGRRFDADGAPLGGEFRVNTTTEGIQAFPAVGTLADGGFVVAWVAFEGADGAGQGVFAQRYDAAGAPVGGEFRVVASVVRLADRAVSVVRDARNGFAIGWAASYTTYAVRRFDGSGVPVTDTLRADAFGLFPCQLGGQLVSDGEGRLMIVRDASYPISHSFIAFGGPLWPESLQVDGQPSGHSDANGVLDPGEQVVVAPRWRNVGPASVAFDGTLAWFTGPGAPTNPGYVVIKGTATYGTVAEGAGATCSPASACYVVGVTPASPRPMQHVDAFLDERLSVASGPDESRVWRVHVGGSFTDVPRTSPYYRDAETMLHFGISSGCGTGAFCPDAVVTREQMATLVLLARFPVRTSSWPDTAPYFPPQPAQGIFHDVPPSSPFAPWIEDLARRGVVTGCSPILFCPQKQVTRAQTAVMLLRTLEGGSYTPPPCTTPRFNDVPCTSPYAPYVNELVARGIAGACGTGRFCPDGAVTRGTMAGFLARTFALDLYQPAEVLDENAIAHRPLQRSRRPS